MTAGQSTQGGKCGETSKERSRMIPDSRGTALKLSSLQAMCVEVWRSIVAGGGRRSEETTEQNERKALGWKGDQCTEGWECNNGIGGKRGQLRERSRNRNEMDNYRGL